MHSSFFIFAFTFVGAVVNAKMAKHATKSQSTSPLADHHSVLNAPTNPQACVTLSQNCTTCLARCYKHHNIWGFATKDDCYTGQCYSPNVTTPEEPCVGEIKVKKCSIAPPKPGMTPDLCCQL